AMVVARSADGSCAARGSDRRRCDRAAFTGCAARRSASRSGIARARPWRFRSLTVFVRHARLGAPAACRLAIVLYMARRIVYGVDGRDATRRWSDAIAMRHGLPGVGGVPASLGHVLVNDVKDSPRTAVNVDDRLIAT